MMIKWDEHWSNYARGYYRSQDAKGHLSVLLAPLRILLLVISWYCLWCVCVCVREKAREREREEGDIAFWIFHLIDTNCSTASSCCFIVG